MGVGVGDAAEADVAVVKLAKIADAVMAPILIRLRRDLRIPLGKFSVFII